MAATREATEPDTRRSSANEPATPSVRARLRTLREWMVAAPDDRRVAVAAIDFVYANLQEISRLQIVFPIVVTTAFWGRVPHAANLAWCGSLITVYVARVALARRYARLPSASRDPYAWGRRFTLTSVVSGLLWGTSAFLFHVPDAETQRMMLYVLSVGVAAGAIVISSYWLISYFAYTLPAILLLVLDLALRGDTSERILASLLLLYIVTHARVARSVHDQAYEGIELRFENDALIERLAEEKAIAEDANRAKTRFLAAANHDLRQPVHAQSLLLHALESEPMSAAGTRIREQLGRATGNLASLLEALLDLSRLDAGATRADIAEHDISELAVRLETEYLPIAVERGLTLRVRACDGTVRTDATLLLRLLGNLLSNAVRYTTEGGVLLGFRRRGGRILIQVWDTGIGIAESDARNVFREFYQVDNAERRRENGLGLGLAICSRIAGLLGVEIGMRSRVGCGTVIELFVEAVAEPLPPPAAGPAPIDIDVLRGRCVLLVDDDPLGREALGDVLMREGMTVLLAASAAEAIALVRGWPTPPDMIVSDYRISKNWTGTQLIEALRTDASPAEIPAVIITGDTAVDVLRLMASSGLPVLSKPIVPQMLLSQMASLMTSRLPGGSREDVSSGVVQPLARD